ncbi:hypothetical protein BDP81DRAFT_426024 [Colletotrichum phormii]|uniref:Uncharacterized protein n=1 Tax=Colletotrichum phormii TaxID=359342 RepID=A0AAJ0EG81_9PEZI|nr:uncharacterized protein BDP81DRAFT_426024 [Colletotrichum phormii]KAK1637838.1 hypothetical protein BDP81DRAFT_426024 [Colletotrichum phormii]
MQRHVTSISLGILFFGHRNGKGIDADRQGRQGEESVEKLHLEESRSRCEKFEMVVRERLESEVCWMMRKKNQFEAGSRLDLKVNRSTYFVTRKRLKS